MTPKRKVLLADDDPTIRHLVALTLGAQLFDVLTASDGAAALDLARADPPDLVLLDAMMPEIDGYAVASALRADPRTARARIIMLTARGSPDDVARGRASGVDEYFVKPFSPLQLLNAVDKLLDGPPDRIWSTTLLRDG